MPIQTRSLLAGLIFLARAGTCFSQTAAEPPTGQQARYYRLEFTVKELDGPKVINNRKYVTIVKSNSGGFASSIRSGDRLPVRSSIPGNVNFTYVEVGVNIDCRDVIELQSQLALYVSTDISTNAPREEGSGPPVIRNNKWQSNLIVPLRKATMLFSSDDASSSHQMQLELTATPIT